MTTTEIITTPADLMTAIASIQETTQAEMVCDVIGRLETFEQRAKEYRHLLTERLIEWINANGELVIGDIRYYVGAKKTTKCVDVPAAVEAILNATGGDFTKFCELLASQPVKHGAAREVLPPETFDKLFSVETEQEIREGKPQAAKRLQKVNTKFLKG